MDFRIAKSLRFMERNLGQTCAIAHVAAQTGLSLHHFHRLFIEEIAEPPASFLRRIRMDNAAFRLKWSDEPVALVAHAVGFQSRPAFTRAFERRFGLSPAQYRQQHRDGFDLSTQVGGRDIRLRSVDSFTLLAKRYTGCVFDVRACWQDFLSHLPDDIARTGLYIGQLHDDFRITEAGKVRYDCGVTVGNLDPDRVGILAVKGVHLIETHAGRYATIRHEGHFEQVVASYDLCSGWLTPNGYAPGIKPALEVHTIPRHLQDKERLSFSIFIPVE